MYTPPSKRKLDLEIESEKKKGRIITITSSDVETIEKEGEMEEEEEGDSVIDIKKMAPKQLLKVSEKLKIQAEKAKLRGKKKKARILTSAKTNLSDLIMNITREVLHERKSCIIPKNLEFHRESHGFSYNPKFLHIPSSRF